VTKYFANDESFFPDEIIPDQYRTHIQTFTETTRHVSLSPHKQFNILSKNATAFYGITRSAELCNDLLIPHYQSPKK